MQKAKKKLFFADSTRVERGPSAACWPPLLGAAARRIPWFPFAIGALLLASSLPGQTFIPATAGYQFAFPRDHGSHDEYRTEWWYYTGHLRTNSGRRYGFELTFFRVGVVPPAVPQQTRWDLRNLSLAHFAVTDVDGKTFHYAEKLNRSSPFTAGASDTHLDVFNEGWRATTRPDGSWRINAFAGGDAIELDLTSEKPPPSTARTASASKPKARATPRTTTR
jgi:Predicted secreted hydrolase